MMISRKDLIILQKKNIVQWQTYEAFMYLSSYFNINLENTMLLH